MTNKDFVLSLYQRAYFSRSMINMCIEISDPPYKAIGYCGGSTEKMTWWYARKDIEFDMIRKLAQ
jgi:hypothetical protein